MIEALIIFSLITLILAVAAFFDRPRTTVIHVSTNLGQVIPFKKREGE